MAPSKTSSKRSTARRSPQGNGNSSGDKATSSTGTQDAGPGQASGGEAPKATFEEQLVALVQQDAIRLIDDKGKDVKDPQAQYLAWWETASGLAGNVKSDAKRLDTSAVKLSQFCVYMREHTILADGRRDWSGSSESYKQVIEKLVDASQAPTEARSTARNRLQSRIRAALDARMVEYTIETKGLKISEDKVKTALKAGHGATKSDDQEVLEFIAAVNETYRVGVHADNEPMSPFEPRETRAPGVPTTDEQKGLEALKTISAFRQTIKDGTVTLDVLFDTLLGIAQDVHRVVLPPKDGKQPRYGETSRDKISEICFSIGTIYTETGRLAGEHKQTKEQESDLNAALNAKF